MTSAYVLWAALLAAMFLGIDGNEPAGSLSLKELESRCQKDNRSIFAHPGQCQLYYNCSNTETDRSYFTKYLEECPYPQLFSTLTSRCQPFDEVTCGVRQELVDKCDYLLHRPRSLKLSHRTPCWVDSPSCKGLQDGVNVRQNRMWSPYYVVCRLQRTVATGTCPKHDSLQMTQLLHPKKRRCVSLYEIPKEHSGLEMSCTRKADGVYLDDVTSRPNVYYSCQCGQLVVVQKCPDGQYFDEWMALCSAKPMYNSITGHRSVGTS